TNPTASAAANTTLCMSALPFISRGAGRWRTAIDRNPQPGGCIAPSGGRMRAPRARPLRIALVRPRSLGLFVKCNVLRSCDMARGKSRRPAAKAKKTKTKAKKAGKSAKPIELYYWPTPNGFKISIMLEECGLPYVLKPVNISKGEQFNPDFLKISPTNR